NLEAVIRELKEETGIVIDSAKCRTVTSGRWQTDRLGHSYEVFYCRLPAPLPVKMRRPELIDCRWLHSYELSSDNCPQDVLRALGAAGLV
ncbi:MAG TPA: NUDIX hydrolase, partial [Candidatus Saccharimonadales bacterium]|nr:NUDIX hydrolase [Candidatus Saccharimonadales bacterium]